MTVVDLDVRTRGRPEPRPRLLAAAALVVAVVTGALLALELLRPVHGVDRGARAAIETAIVAAALLAGHLLIEASEGRARLRDVLLGLGVFALAVAGFSDWVGSVVSGAPRATVGGVIRLACELIGAFAFVAAAFVPSTATVRARGVHVRVAAAFGACAVVGAIVLADALAAHPSASPGAGTFEAHTVAMVAGVVAAVAFAAAALAFAARSWRVETGTELLAGASLLLAAACVQFVVAPRVGVDWVTPGDGARLLAFVLLLGGAHLRCAAVRRRRAHTAIRSERERVARDLHDGLAQDLACITTQAQRLDCDLGPQDPLMLATRDALGELREMITDLTASAADSSEDAVRLVAHQMGRRLDLDVEVRASADASCAQDGGLEFGDDLVRATREAIVDAVADGQGRHVAISLSRRSGHVVVRVWGGGRVPDRSDGSAARTRHARRMPRLSAGRSRRASRPRAV